LNVLRAPDLLMAADPNWLRVSVSGFTQEFYALGHTGGNIETVKTNMRRLAQAKQAANATTDLEFYFHRHVDNEADEAPAREFAESLGFRFVAGWALMFPLEKRLTIADPAHPRATITAADRAIMSRLALKMDQVIAITSQRPVSSCTLQDN
jgi:hypothetical protein